jgi:mannose-6-phosphate isomerase-like protein (cupin superfamily)
VSAVAQQSNIKRTPLQTVDFPPGYNVVTAIAEVPPGYCTGRHPHPGVESTYVMEGAILVKIEGQPDKVFKAGESFQIPRTPRRLHGAGRGVQSARNLHRRKGQAAGLFGAVNLASMRGNRKCRRTGQTHHPCIWRCPAHYGRWP